MASNAIQKNLVTSELRPDTSFLASICKAAADPLRLDIMRVLSQDSFGVQELASIFEIPQPGMSHHLKILATNGLLVARRQGNSIFYRRALLKEEDALSAFQASLYFAIDAFPLSSEQRRKIAEVYEERSRQSRNYFARNAEKFDEQQGMLCELSQYFPNLKELLDLMQVPKASRVMEVGPGQGLLLDELAKRFDNLVALDISGEMLALAKGKVIGKSRKIEFVNSSLEAYEPNAKKPLNAVVLNMVLHHMASPEGALRKLGKIIASGGYLAIADLCSHNQEWTRESCGDVWLGFDPQDLNEWAVKAGFEAGQSLYLGLKNGFQIQLKLFYKI